MCPSSPGALIVSLESMLHGRWLISIVFDLWRALNPLSTLVLKTAVSHLLSQHSCEELNLCHIFYDLLQGELLLLVIERELFS